MSNYNNVQPIDTGSRSAGFDPGTYFNNLSFAPLEISTNVSHAVQSFFEKYTDNKRSAEILASSVIFTSASQGVDPMQTLDEFLKLPPGDLNEFLVTFLNFNRVGTSLLGLPNTTRPLNKVIQRTILV